MLRFGQISAWITVLASVCSAGDPTYWQDVRPILRKHCTVCHNERRVDELEVSGGLALDSPAAILKGGKQAVLVPQHPEQSLFITLLTSKDPKRAMPLDADPLPAEEIAVLRRWVELGAPEGDRPGGESTASVAVPPVAKFRKLPVTLVTKAVLPKTSKTPGALSLRLPIGPLPPVSALAFSPNSQQLAVGVYGRVTVWDLASGRPVSVLTNVLGSVNDVKFSPDGSLLAVAGGQPSSRGDLRLFSTKDWKIVGTLGGHKDVVSSVAFSGDGRRLVTASFDKTARLWNVADPTHPQLLHTFTGHTDFLYGVAFSPDGRWYATASKDNTGRVVDAETGASRLTLSGNDQEVYAVAILPDGEKILTSGQDPRLNVWESKQGERLKQIAGPGLASYELAVDSQGKLGVVAGGDRTARLFDAKSFAVTKSLPHDAVVFAVAIDPSGQRIATGGTDGLTKLWTADGTQIATLWSGAGEGELGSWLVLLPDGGHVGAESLLSQAEWLAGSTPADVMAVTPLYKREGIKGLLSVASANPAKAAEVPPK